ncbi:MAG: hypothetical protein ABW019_08930 [Chitinophagaceae bacterium]
MSTSLPEFIQKKLGFPPLRRVDPVDHAVKAESEPAAREKLGQAAIPATLAALYRFAKTGKGSRAVLANDSEGRKWLEVIMSWDDGSAVDKVTRYAGVSDAEAAAIMEIIAVEAVFAIRDSVAHNPGADAVQRYMGDQRQAILVYLPAEVQLEHLLADHPGDEYAQPARLAQSLESRFFSVRV